MSRIKKIQTDRHSLEPESSCSRGSPVIFIGVSLGSGSYLNRKVLVKIPDAFLDSPHFCAVQFHFRIKSISVNKWMAQLKRCARYGSDRRMGRENFKNISYSQNQTPFVTTANLCLFLSIASPNLQIKSQMFSTG